MQQNDGRRALERSRTVVARRAFKAIVACIENSRRDANKRATKQW